MKIVAQTVNTKDVEITVTATMTVEAWEAMMKELPENKRWPLYQYAAAISSAVSKVKNNLQVETTE